ncbi:hypothetical protein HGRIS_005930 [Hohenbuehelia grisea]|uniref:Ubiquitin-like protease family profile domain-containing protein n=1 Tax=Hohenbuehelia grisea TaxID=104357 RepID=A0ABR3K085_9AGAR
MMPSNPLASKTLGNSNRRFASRYGNLTSSQTLTQPEHPNKKRKIQLRQTLASKTDPFVYTGKGKGKERVLLAPDFDDDYLTTEDNIEIGEPLVFPRSRSSSDPLNSLEEHGGPSTSKSVSGKASTSQYFSSSSSSTRRPPEGESMKRLKKSVAASAAGQQDEPIVIPSDDIEQYSDDPHTKPAPASTQGRVKEMVEHYEEKAERPKLIDLSKRSNMKPKKLEMQTLRPLPTPKAQDSLASKTPFVNGDASRNKAGLGRHDRPEREIFIDTLFVGVGKMGQSAEPASLTWTDRPPTVTLSFYDPSSEEWKSLELDPRTIIGLESTSKATTYALQLRLKRGCPPSLPHFQPGEKDKDSITIRFDSNQANIEHKHSLLIAFLGALAECISDIIQGQKGADSFWEGKTRILESDNHRLLKGPAHGTESTRAVARMKPAAKRKAPDDAASNVEPGEVSTSEPLPDSTGQKTTSKPRQKKELHLNGNGNSGPSGGVLRRSARQPGGHDGESKRASPLGDPDEVILVYPPATVGAVTIKNSDLLRLQPGEYLNDTLIEFGLKLWLKDLEDKNPAFARTIHVFSSFFYKKLNKRNLEEGYQSVKKWTSKVDLFDKKFIIIPINENLHWYLAIIYQPEHVLQPQIPETPKPVNTRRRARESGPQVPDVLPSVSRKPSPTVSDYKAPEDELATQTGSMEITPSQELVSPFHEQQTTVNGKPASVPDPGYLISLLSRKEEEEDGEEEEEEEEEDGVKKGEMVGGGPWGMDPGSSPLSDLPESDPPMPVDETFDKLPIPDVEVDSKTATPPSSPGSSMRAVEDVDEALQISEADSMVLDDAFDDGAEAESATAGNPIETSSFYGPTTKTKGGKPSRSVPISDAVAEMDVDLPDDEVQVVDRPTTYIITFDSLGSRHPKVYTTLRQYLKMEARDKKGYEMPSDAKGLQAMVPPQPNYCDCGIYLLHFAQTFMSDPVKYFEMAKIKRTELAQRRQDWDDAKVGTARERLASRITELSAVWKKEREAKLRDEEAQKREAAALKAAAEAASTTLNAPDSAIGEDGDNKEQALTASLDADSAETKADQAQSKPQVVPHVIDSDSDDVEVLEHTLPPKTLRQAKRGDAKKRGSKQSKATRLR